MAAYARHAANLGYEDYAGVYAVIENAMAETARSEIGVDELFQLVLNVGNGGVNVMALLDKANHGDLRKSGNYKGRYRSA